MTPKAQAPKPKMNKKDYIKPKSFFTAKETINKIIRQTMKWEKIFTNNTDKGFIPKIYKEFTQFNSKKKSKQSY